MSMEIIMAFDLSYLNIFRYDLCATWTFNSRYVLRLEKSNTPNNVDVQYSSCRMESDVM